MVKISNGKCAHNLKNSGKTCFSKESLIKIANAYNKKYPDKKISTSCSKIKLWNNIRDALNDVCNEETCWPEQDFIKNLNNDDINYFTHKPKMPDTWKKNKHTWLNTHDIFYVMKQFEKNYNDFVFFGPVPSDCPVSFQCELSSIDPINLHNNKKISKIGIVYNLDKHNEPGSHWTAVLINTPENEINYYDSYGEKPTELIYKFMKKMGDKFKKNNRSVHLIYNDKRHQYGGSECGIYSMYFLLQRLEGQSMNDIYKKKIKDSYMNKLRDVLYLK